MQYILLTRPSKSSINYVLKSSKLLLTIDSTSDHFSTLAFESAIELQLQLQTSMFDFGLLQWFEAPINKQNSELMMDVDVVLICFHRIWLFWEAEDRENW